MRHPVRRRLSPRRLGLALAGAAALLCLPPAGLPALAAGAAGAGISAKQQRQAIDALPERYRTWLEEFEALITAQEREAFLALTRDYERDAFIKRFWEVRNRQRGAMRQEVRDLYAARVAEARSRYGDLHDARARILIRNGEPGEIVKAECQTLLWPLEIWHYQAHAADLLQDESYVVFYRHWNVGLYRLWDRRDGFDVLFADRGAGGPGKADFNGLLLDCRDGDVLVKWLRRGAGPLEIAALDGQPKPPGGEWVSTFRSYSTDVPADAARLPAELAVSFPGRRDGRTVVQGVFSVAADAAVPIRLGGRGWYDFLLTGEILADGELFESFRYKFDLPALAAAGGAAAGAETRSSGIVPLVFQRPLRPGDYTLVVKLEDLNSGRLLRLERPLAVPRVEAVLSAPAEALGSGADAGVRRILEEANAALAAGDTTIKLVAPPGELRTGMTRIDALATGAGIDHVTFALDGRAVLTKRKPPFSVELDLGTAPRTHLLAAVAYDASGATLGADELVVNSAGHRFRVRLVEPRRGNKVRGSLLARAEVEPPEGEEGVERVELYLGDRLAATLYQPPYEQAMVVPQDQALSYVRAVAYLRDGSSSEDLVFVNAPEDLEQVNVQYVELYASVLDRHGRPVAGVAANRFTVLEDGVRQDLVRRERVSDLPVHVAVLLDTSASMESSLETARHAVLRFLATAIKPRDRAAVITFNDHPNLAVKFSNDQAQLAAGLAGVKAERGTALYDTLIYAFYYFNGVKGQRAILLVTDGRDENSRFTFEEALETARRAGITLYVIGLGDEVEKRKLSRLCEETGGRAFFLESAADLAAIYATIQEELRSKVLLAYQSKNTSTGSNFRTLEVKLEPSAGLEVKAPRGYYP
jgi:Ca-activated chloride channel family protein